MFFYKTNFYTILKNGANSTPFVKNGLRFFLRVTSSLAETFLLILLFIFSSNSKNKNSKKLAYVLPVVSMYPCKFKKLDRWVECDFSVRRGGLTTGTVQYQYLYSTVPVGGGVLVCYGRQQSLFGTAVVLYQYLVPVQINTYKLKTIFARYVQ